MFFQFPFSCPVPFRFPSSSLPSSLRGIFNRARERELEKHRIFDHAQKKEQQQEEEQEEEEQQQQKQEQKQVGRTNTDVKQKNALAHYLSVHHH